MQSHYSVAIDGPSGAGKSTIARAAAKRFGFIYVDTGAIYRTVGLAVERAGIAYGDEDAVRALLPKIRVSFDYNAEGEQRDFLNGEDVTGLIRTPEMSRRASDVSAMPCVRAFLLDMQRDMAKSHNVIMDGRDIGSVVLPRADVKIFLTASSECRAERRYRELVNSGEVISYDEVLKNVLERDSHDSNRAAAPMIIPKGARTIDTSELNLEESIEVVCAVIAAVLGVDI